MTQTTQQERLRELLREALALLDEQPAPAATTAAAEVAPWEKPPRAENPNERTITGKVGNPQLSHPKDKVLWKAGIGVADANGRLQWVNVIAWGELAEYANQFSRGDMVTVTGTSQSRNYVDSNGVARTRDEFTISSIDWAE